MRRHPLSAASLVGMTSMLAGMAHAQPDVVVRGDVACPSAEMIRAALTVAPPGGEWPEQQVTVEASADRLVVSLGHAPAVRREIPADKDCSVRAASVALIIGVWSGQLTSRSTGTPVLSAARPAAPAALQPPSRHVIEVDGAAFYSPLWGHAIGAWLAAGRVPRNGGIGVRVLGAYQAARDIPLEGGSNLIARFLAGAAVTYHVQRTRVFAAGDLGVVGTLLRAQGTGYEENRTDSTTNVGGLADVRAGLRLGRYRLWGNARLLGMVHAEAVKIQSTSPGVADRSTFNRWDAQLGLGMGFRFE